MKFLFTSLFAVFTATFAVAQCNISIDLPQEIIFCQVGATSVLMPSIQGDYDSFEWSPTTGLSSPNNLTPTVTAVSNTTYTLTVNSISDTELISNGDFGQGDTGFTSDYIYGTGGGVGLLSNAGEYAVVANAGSTHNQFADCNDHTGGGNMMVVNASGDASNIWCQDIIVNMNTSYSFSAWATSVVSQNPAQLQFSVNGILFGTPFNALSNTCNWQQFSAEWTSANVTTAQICIANTNFTPAGNDFALDDISFREICMVSETVDIQIADLTASINVPTEICAGSGLANLQDFLNNNTTSGGSWELDNQIITTLNANTIPLGPHSLEYIVTLGSCTISDQVNFELVAAPEAGIAIDRNGCLGTLFPINLFDQLSGHDTGGTWSLLSGSAMGNLNATSGDYTHTEAGEFVFQYAVNGTGFCPADQVTVTLVSFAPPVADLPIELTLDCITPSSVLSGITTSTGANIQYNWLLDGLPIINNNPALTIDQQGVYQLEVVDMNTTCSAIANSNVINLVNVISFVSEETPAPCDNPNGGLIIFSQLQGGTLPYLTSVDGENFVFADSFPNLPPGNYTLQVQDAGGCEASLEVNLPMPTFPDLILQATTNAIIPLGESLSLLAVSNPPLELLDTFIWTPAIPDSLRIGPKQWHIQPTETTLYTLMVSDANGCTSEASIQVQVRPEGNVFIANAFSPNDDGSNDRFMIHDNGAIININQLQIFNRWGVQVYAEKDLKANSNDRMWDGKFNGEKLPKGIYVYSAEVVWLNGETSQLQGEISIVY